MVLTDTHTHLYYQEGEELQAEIQRSLDQGISRFFLPNVDVDSIEKIYDTVSQFPAHCFPMLGLHPCEVKENYEEQLKIIKASLDVKRVYAIGEIGLDLYWDKTTLDIQQRAFKAQVDWAKAKDLPIIIHCREAFEEQFKLLEELKDEKLRGVFHCFTGTLAQAQRAISLGFYLGIGGVLTYKKSGLAAVLEQVSLAHIVLETDAPYLAPVPHRGKKNESSFMIHVAQKVAEIKGLSIEEVAEITTENSKIIFKI